jgi:hypothetical protein
MSNASVTPRMREYGWNIHFLASPSAFHFAGLFQLEGSNMVTFRDVLAEMRLCFDLPGDDSDPDPWSNFGFSFAGLVNMPPGAMSASGYPAFVCQTELDLPVPAPPATSADQHPIVRFYLVRHTPCSLPSAAPLASHLQGSSSHKLDILHM